MYKMTNCKNCGSALHNQNSRICKCEYCGTEYHLDDLGRIEEYKVKLDVMGREMMFYISEIRCEPTTIDCTCLYDKIPRHIVGRNNFEITLVSLN